MATGWRQTIYFCSYVWVCCPEPQLKPMSSYTQSTHLYAHKAMRRLAF
jgi:hypothetical protein